MSIIKRISEFLQRKANLPQAPIACIADQLHLIPVNVHLRVHDVHGLHVQVSDRDTCQLLICRKLIQPLLRHPEGHADLNHTFPDNIPLRGSCLCHAAAVCLHIR